MLKNIRLHIEQDEERQEALEQSLAQHIALTNIQNVNAFQRHIPSLVTHVEQIVSQNISKINTQFLCLFK